MHFINSGEQASAASAIKSGDEDEDDEEKEMVQVASKKPVARRVVDIVDDDVKPSLWKQQACFCLLSAF